MAGFGTPIRTATKEEQQELDRIYNEMLNLAVEYVIKEADSVEYADACWNTYGNKIREDNILRRLKRGLHSRIAEELSLRERWEED